MPKNGTTKTPPVGFIVTVVLQTASLENLGITFGDRDISSSKKNSGNDDDTYNTKKTVPVVAVDDDTNNKAMVIISDIARDGLAHLTELHKGMQVLSLNGVENLFSSAQAHQILSQAVAGTMTVQIVARHPLGFIPIICILPGTTGTGTTPDDLERPLQLGIGLGSARERQQKEMVVVTKICKNSPASQTPLQEGMIIRAVNHKKCGEMTFKQVYDLVQKALLEHQPQSSQRVVKFLAEASNPYSRRAETELLDTFGKPSPPNLATGGYWLCRRYCGWKDLVILPCTFVAASMGLVITNRRKSMLYIYVVNGQAYDTHGKHIGEESQFLPE